MGRTITSFRYVRARVCRVGNGSWLAGWVSHLGHDAARIHLQAFVALRPGEPLIVVCYGDGTLARFIGRAVAQAGHEVAVACASALSFHPSSENVRLALEGVDGLLRAGKRSATLLAMDASPGSLGGLSDEPFAPGAILRMALQTPRGRFEAEVGVINCRTEPSQEGEYRVGLRILGASRLDLALWGRMLQERAEG